MHHIQALQAMQSNYICLPLKNLLLKTQRLMHNHLFQKHANRPSVYGANQQAHSKIEKTIYTNTMFFKAF